MRTFHDTESEWLGCSICNPPNYYDGKNYNDPDNQSDEYEESDDMTTIQVERETADNRKRAEEKAKRELKYAKEGGNAAVEVEALTFGADPSISLYVSNGRDGDSYKAVNVRLSEKDAERVQTAIYNARVKLNNAVNKSKITNPTLSPYNFSLSAF